ncbi:unnamed protein product [Litomosoides sigmodontis]|uniref:Ras association domain-containing protein n=1 Tax=Litomosoides sigmodontis TaxID=42156 RepID=A0A3P6TX84_LITSI|nr:unnamed protein product [Litomosoides sigmodontis]
MEIRVIVDGVERSVSGITDTTTCAQIIYALANATRQKGRFVLIENFRNTEKSLAPLDRPLEMLRKWGIHSNHVTFLLKHLDEGPSSVTSETFVDTSNQLEYSHPEEPPFSSIDIPVQQSTLACGSDSEENRGTALSTAVLPSVPGKLKIYCFWLAKICLTIVESLQQFCRPIFQKFSSQTGTNERIRSRPPPPAYHEVIGQRFTSLSRQNIPSSSLTSLHSVDTSIDDQCRLTNYVTSQPASLNNNDALTRKLSANALEGLVQNQKQVIEQQKAYLAKLDLAIDNDQQREVIQLRRQQENLRTVLSPLRECDWPNRLQREHIELQKITASISEFKQKLDAITNEIRLRIDEKHNLKCNILMMEEELKQLEDDVDIAKLSENNH